MKDYDRFILAFLHERKGRVAIFEIFNALCDHWRSLGYTPDDDRPKTSIGLALSMLESSHHVNHFETPSSNWRFDDHEVYALSDEWRRYAQTPECPIPRKESKKWMRELRTDLVTLRSNTSPIAARLVHHGYLSGFGIPESIVHLHSSTPIADRDKWLYNYIEPSPGGGPARNWEAENAPFHPAAANGISMSGPAFRVLELGGRWRDIDRLEALIARGGAIVSQWPTHRIFGLFDEGWRFRTPSGLWWTLMFELGWSNSHPLLSISRQLWIYMPIRIPVPFPYEVAAIQQAAARVLARGGTFPIPNMTALPDEYTADCPDVISACITLADVFLEESTDTDGLPKPAMGDMQTKEFTQQQASAPEVEVLIDDTTFSVRFNETSVELGNTVQFRLMKSLVKSAGRFVNFSTLASECDCADEESVKHIKARLVKELRSGGLSALAECIDTEPGHYRINPPSA